MPPPDGFRQNFSRTVHARIVKFYTLIKTSGPTNLPEMVSSAPSGRLQNAIKDYRKVRKTGPKCGKKAYNSEMVRDTAKESVKGVFKSLT